jgi:hypothetical protein
MLNSLQIGGFNNNVCGLLIGILSPEALDRRSLMWKTRLKHGGIV